MKTYSGMIWLTLFAATASGASAQYVYSPPVYSPLNAITSDVRYQGVVSSLNDSVNDQFVDQDSTSPVVPLANQTFTFVSDRGRTRQNLRNFVTRTPDPAARAELEQMIAAQPTLMDDIGAGVRGYGFDPHNVADAYAVWWINVWGASQKRNIEPDAQTVEAVKQQVRNAFAATPDMANTPDAVRQEYAEALLVQAAMLGSAFEQMKGDPQLLDQLAEAARKGAKASGLDLSLMTLTPNGFVPRKGADAGEESVRNARVEAPGADGESSGMGLALAAGAGLGLTLLGGAALLRKHG